MKGKAKKKNRQGKDVIDRSKKQTHMNIYLSIWFPYHAIMDKQLRYKLKEQWRYER